MRTALSCVLLAALLALPGFGECGTRLDATNEEYTEGWPGWDYGATCATVGGNGKVYAAGYANSPIKSVILEFDSHLGNKRQVAAFEIPAHETVITDIIERNGLIIVCGTTSSAPPCPGFIRGYEMNGALRWEYLNYSTDLGIQQMAYDKDKDEIWATYSSGSVSRVLHVNAENGVWDAFVPNGMPTSRCVSIALAEKSVYLGGDRGASPAPVGPFIAELDRETQNVVRTMAPDYYRRQTPNPDSARFSSLAVRGREIYGFLSQMYSASTGLYGSMCRFDYDTLQIEEIKIFDMGLPGPSWCIPPGHVVMHPNLPLVLGMGGNILVAVREGGLEEYFRVDQGISTFLGKVALTGGLYGDAYLPRVKDSYADSKFAVQRYRFMAQGGESSKFFIAPNVVNFSDPASLPRFVVAGNPGAGFMIRVFDAAGRIVRILDAQIGENSWADIGFDCRTIDGKKLAPGMYWVRIEGQDAVDTLTQRFLIRPGRDQK